MDYRYFYAFLSVGKNLSFTKAAEDLNVTTAAICRQIKLLEVSLERQLFIRSPQDVALTPEGEKLLKEGLRFEGWLDSELKGKKQIIRISVLQGVLENWLLKVIASTPNMNFHIRMGGQDEIDSDINEGRVDVAINSHNIQSEQLTSFRIFKEEIVIVSKKPIDISKVHQYPWVTFDPKTYLIPYCKKMSDQIIQVESINAILRLVEMGLGVTMVPSHLITNPRNLKIYLINKFKSDIWATTLNYKTLPPHLDLFIKMMRKNSIPLKQK